MKCGAKCFLVEIEKDGVTKQIPVHARTPVAARKVIRKELGANTKIIRVIKE